MNRRINIFRAGLYSALFIAAMHTSVCGADQTSSAGVIRRFKELTGLSKANTNQAYHLSGTFITADGKITGALDVDQMDREHQWSQVEIAQHGKHIRAKSGGRMWHFDPPANSRAGDGWFIYPRPGYAYGANESQTRFHELLDVYDALHNPNYDPVATIMPFNGANAVQIARVRSANRKSQEIFDASSGLKVAVIYSEPEPATFLLSNYKDLGGIKLPSRITEVVRGKTNDIFTLNALTFTNFSTSRFAMPLRVRDWPAGWNEFDEAYPPALFRQRTVAVERRTQPLFSRRVWPNEQSVLLVVCRI
jgi:hypothetical protein